MDLERSPSVLSDMSDIDMMSDGGRGSSSEEVSRMLGSTRASSSEPEGSASAITRRILRKRSAIAPNYTGAKISRPQKRRKTDHGSAMFLASPSSAASSSTLVDNAKKRGRPRKSTQTFTASSSPSEIGNPVYVAPDADGLPEGYHYCKWKVIAGYEGPYFWPDKLKQDDSLNVSYRNVSSSRLRC